MLARRYEIIIEDVISLATPFVVRTASLEFVAAQMDLIPKYSVSSRPHIREIIQRYVFRGDYAASSILQ